MTYVLQLSSTTTTPPFLLLCCFTVSPILTPVNITISAHTFDHHIIARLPPHLSINKERCPSNTVFTSIFSLNIIPHVTLEGGGVANSTPQPVYTWERPGTHCTGGSVSPRAGMDGCGKSHSYQKLISRSSSL
jgi:hypothetical protein